jgi:membrane protein
VAEHAALTRARRVATGVADLYPVRVLRGFFDHRGGSQAVLIAWNALTAVFPIVLAVAAVAGVLLSVTGVTPDAIVRQVIAIFPQDLGAQSAALSAIDGLRREASVLALLALAGFLWTGSNLFGAMEEAFGVVFATQPRPFLRQKVMALGMMGLFAVAALLAIGTSALLPLLADLPGMPISLTSGWTGQAVQVAIGLIAGFVLYFAIYYIVPNRRLHVRCVWPGALFAGVAFELLSQLFPFYIRVNQSINRYGQQFAFLFVLLAFFYFLGVITMIGAEMIAALERPSSPSSPDR